MRRLSCIPGESWYNGGIIGRGWKFYEKISFDMDADVPAVGFGPARGGVGGFSGAAVREA